MPELQDSVLGTPTEHKVMHAVARTTSRLVGDLFVANYIIDCLKMVSGLGDIHKILLVDAGQKRGAPSQTIAQLVAQANDNIRWVSEMQNENYHRVSVLAFLSLWAAFESGNENIIATVIQTVHPAANSAAERFSKGKYDVSSWPWAEEKCFEIAQKLDQKAKSETHDGGWDIASRLTTLFGWLGAKLCISVDTAEKLNEASMVRNVLLHRYGRLSPRDIQRAPHLVVTDTNAVHITRARLGEYSQAVNETHVAVMRGVAAAGWM